jgi:hypothetical protein
MSLLSDLKAIAQDQLAKAHADVQHYVQELEAKVQGKRWFAWACGGLGFLVGVAAGHYL